METRQRKRQRIVREIERSKEILATIPYEILCHILTFIIIFNEDAKVVWIVFPDWRPCIKVIFAKLNPTWDFKASCVSPIRFRQGMAFWSTALYDMINRITFYGDIFLRKGSEPESCIKVTTPNIIEIYDKAGDYRFAFRFKCPCTIWYRDQHFTLEKNYTHNSKKGFIYINQHQIGLIDATYPKKCRSITRNCLFSIKANILILEEEGFDVQLSYESFNDLEKLANLFTSNDHFMYKNIYVSIYIINGVIILGGQKKGFTGSDGWLPVWNNKGLSMEEMIKVWPEDEELDVMCYPQMRSLKAWICHLNIIKPFDFINLRIIHQGTLWDYNRLYSYVIKDGMSMCFEF